MLTNRSGLVFFLLVLLSALSACDRPAPSASAPTAAAAAGAGSARNGAPAAPAALSDAAPASATPAAPVTPTVLTTAPAPAAPASPTGPARIAFATSTYNFGSMLETEKRTARLNFTNVGGEMLNISEVKTSCGCTTTRMSKYNFAPGESGHLDVTFEPTAPGAQAKSVNVMSNGSGSEDGITRLQISANVQPFLAVEPRLLQFGEKDFRKEHHATMVVWCPLDAGYVIEGVKCTNEHLVARLLAPGEAPKDPPSIEPPPGARLIDVAVPAHTPWGGQFGWVEITTRARVTPESEPMTHESRIRVAVRLFGQLNGDPDTFRFGVKPGQAIRSSVRLKRTSGEMYNIYSAKLLTSNIAGARIRVEPQDPHIYELVLEGTAGSEEINYQGIVEVLTNVPGEERIEIPIFGVAREQAGGVK
jgi:hypothetical protein